MMKGDRVRHIKHGYRGTIEEMGPTNSDIQMVRIKRDDRSAVTTHWAQARDLEIIKKVVPTELYFLVSSVVKVDLTKEGWDVGCDASFGLQKMCSREGYCGLSNANDVGVHMIGFKSIPDKEFHKLKYELFTEEGGI
jgi:hypothetical protein